MGSMESTSLSNYQYSATVPSPKPFSPELRPNPLDHSKLSGCSGQQAGGQAVLPCVGNCLKMRFPAASYTCKSGCSPVSQTSNFDGVLPVSGLFRRCLSREISENFRRFSPISPSYLGIRLKFSDNSDTKSISRNSDRIPLPIGESSISALWIL